MTALCYCTEENYCEIAMDAMICDDNYNVLACTTKFFPLLHLNGVVAGTGSFDFIMDWVIYLNKYMKYPNYFDEVDDSMTDYMLNLAKKHKDEYGLDVMSLPTTIYHFGNSEEGFKCLKYHSGNDFKKEEMPRGAIAMKPGLEIVSDGWQDKRRAPVDPESINNNMAVYIEAIKKLQDVSIEKRQVCIGWQIHYALLNEGGIYIQKIYDF